jgi:hypothetical protein
MATTLESDTFRPAVYPRLPRIPYLDRQTYSQNMEIIAHFEPGQLRGRKMQMMALGKQRLLVQGGDIIDVTEPAHPTMLNKGAFDSSIQLQVAYHQRSRKWIAMAGMQMPHLDRSKYDEPSAISIETDYQGLRGVKLYDITDPLNVNLLCEFSTGQTGGSIHRNYWDGGRYAYLTACPDDSFTRVERAYAYYSKVLMIVDMSDPSQPRHVSTWWIPGQKTGEDDEYRQWPEYGDHESYTMLHGPVYVPERVEDGGTRGYGAWGSFGMLIHDLSDIRNPKLISRFNPYAPYGTTIAWHTIWLGALERNIVLSNPEVIDHDEPREVPTWVIDIADERSPRVVGALPRPTPPPEAPYTDFSQKHGRFGTHNPPHLKAPGRPRSEFVSYTWFNAGLRCYDISNPTQPRETAYFVPPQMGSLDNLRSYLRNVDNQFVEWDRNVMYVGTDNGLYVMSTPALGEPSLEPAPVSQWWPRGANVGAA